MTKRIEHKASQAGARIAGRVRYDRLVTLAQMQARAAVEYQTDGCAEDIHDIWGHVKTVFQNMQTRE